MEDKNNCSMVVREELLQAYKEGERNFAGIDLSNVDLTKVDLSGANFSGANLTNANLTRTNLSDCNLQQAKLDRAKCDRTNFSWCNLSQQDLRKLSLVAVDLQGADLSDADLSEADLTEAKLDRANLNRAILTGAKLLYAYMVYANLTEANLTATELVYADLTGANLTSAILERTNLKNARLRKANLSKAILTEAYLQDCNLQLANLDRAKIQQTSFNNALCKRANFSQANLKEVTTELAEDINLESAIIEVDSQEDRHSLHLELEIRGSFAFSPDNKTLAYKNNNDRVRLINIETGAEISQWTLPKFDPTVAVTFDDNGKTLYYSYYVSEFFIWNTKTQEIITKLKNHSANITSIVLNSQGERISKTGTEKTATTFDVGHEVRTFYGYSNTIETTAISPCGKYIARSIPEKCEVELKNKLTGEIIHTFSDYKKPIQSLAFSPDSKLLATYSAKDKRIYQVETGIITHNTYNSPANSLFPSIAFTQLKNDKDPVLVTNCCFLVTGNRNATSSSKKDIKYDWDGSWRSSSIGCDLAYSGDGKIAARRFDTQPVQIWDLSTGKEIATVDLKQQRYQCSYLISLNYTGDLLATVTDKCKLGLWEIKTNKLIYQFKDHINYLKSIKFSSHNDILASAGIDCLIHLWNINTGQLITTLRENSAVISLAFHPHKPILASGNEDGIITLWNTKTYQKIYSYTAYPKPQNRMRSPKVTALQFSPDGNYLASRGTKLCLWTVVLID